MKAEEEILFEDTSKKFVIQRASGVCIENNDTSVCSRAAFCMSC